MTNATRNMIAAYLQREASKQAQHGRGRAARSFQGTIVKRKLETAEVMLDGMAQEPAGYWQTWRKPVKIDDLINVELVEYA